MARRGRQGKLEKRNIEDVVRDYVKTTVHHKSSKLPVMLNDVLTLGELEDEYDISSNLVRYLYSKGVLDVYKKKGLIRHTANTILIHRIVITDIIVYESKLLFDDE